MGFSKYKLVLQAYKASDLLAFLVASLGAAWLSGLYIYEIGVLELLSMRISLMNLIAGSLLSLYWLLVFTKMGLYRPMRSRREIDEEVVLIGWATGIATLGYFLAAVVFEITLFTPIFLLSLWLLSASFTVLFRRATVALLRKVHLGDHNNTRILVVGHGKPARRYAERVVINHDMGFQLVGYMADEPFDEALDYSYLGRFTEFEQVIKENVVDEVVITLPIHEFNKELEALINYATLHGILVRLPMAQLFSSLFGHNVWRLRSEMVSRPGEQMTSDLVLASGHQMGWEYLVKRTLDFVAASIMLAILSPVMFGAFLAIRLTSKGDALFIQDRYGYNGRIIRLYKFRTMIQNADELQEALRKHNEREGAAFKIKDDPRVTRVGKFLRKTSIDELPQLLNVLKGEMSLVGPRPLPLADYKRFQEVSHMRRLSVLPGITCTWQASGRDNVSFDEWMQLDMEYIDNWSLFSDIMILLKTVPVVLFGRGAS